MESATILLVDDDPLYIELTSMMLRGEGYRVLPATQGESGVEIFRKEKPDIVMMDWNLPGLSGIDLLKTFKEHSADSSLPYFIMVSAQREMEYRIGGMEAGADDYITKPFEKEELFARLHVGLRTLNLRRELATQARQRTVVEMAVSMAHEIANPLSTIMLLHHRLSKNVLLNEDPALKADLEMLGQQLLRIQALVRKAQSIETVTSVPYAEDITMIDWHSDEKKK